MDSIVWIPSQLGLRSPSQLSWKDYGSLTARAMDPSQIGLWSPSQIGLWSPSQLSWEDYEALTDRTMEPLTDRTTDPTQLGQRSPSQIGLWSPSQLSCSTGRVPQQLRPLCRVSCWQGRFLDKYILQFWQIHFSIWTNTFHNLDNHILQFGQAYFSICKIHFTIGTNTFGNLDKYIWQLNKYILHRQGSTTIEASL